MLYSYREPDDREPDEVLYMRRYVYIGVGGFGGAVLRFAVKNMQLMNNDYDALLNIWAVNTLGCFILGLFLSISFKILRIDPDMKLGISVGLIGAFTTFSTFCKDIIVLAERSIYIAALYTGMSLLLGFAAILAGEAAAKMIMRNCKKKYNRR
jgi:CrcB protein